MFNGKMKAITFSFDDAVLQDVRMVELLNKYNLKATFNVNSGLLGAGGFLTIADQKIAHYKIKPEDVAHIYDGHEVAVHTLTHPNLTTLDEKEIIRQVEEDRKNLEKLVGYDIVGMAYPCGGVNNDDRVAQIIKENTQIRYCRTITDTDSFDVQENLYRLNPNVHYSNFERMYRMACSFIEMQPDIPQIFYIWGHSYEMDIDSTNWKQVEDFFKFISNRDDIFYGTNKEVLL